MFKYRKQQILTRFERVVLKTVQSYLCSFPIYINKPRLKPLSSDNLKNRQFFCTVYSILCAWEWYGEIFEYVTGIIFIHYKNKQTHTTLSLTLVFNPLVCSAQLIRTDTTETKTVYFPKNEIIFTPLFSTPSLSHFPLCVELDTYPIGHSPSP